MLIFQCATATIFYNVIIFAVDTAIILYNDIFFACDNSIIFYTFFVACETAIVFYSNIIFTCANAYIFYTAIIGIFLLMEPLTPAPQKKVFKSQKSIYTALYLTSPAILQHGHHPP